MRVSDEDQFCLEMPTKLKDIGMAFIFILSVLGSGMLGYRLLNRISALIFT